MHKILQEMLQEEKAKDEGGRLTNEGFENPLCDNLDTLMNTEGTTKGDEIMPNTSSTRQEVHRPRVLH